MDADEGIQRSRRSLSGTVGRPGRDGHSPRSRTATSPGGGKKFPAAR